MSTIKINKRYSIAPRTTFSAQGFQPFFMGASIFAIVSMLAWTAIYSLRIPIVTAPLSSMTWHAHEMIFGYCLAVIAGFLLTAVTNWTGIETATGKPLVLLFSFWVSARILWLFGTSYILWTAILDLLFISMLACAVFHPIFRTKNWRQLGIITKLLLLGTCNLFFYLRALGIFQTGNYWEIYGGFYLVIALVLTIAGRVFPAFVENAVNYDINIKRSRFLTLINLILFLAFFISEIVLSNVIWSELLALCLFAAYSYRLYQWHTFGIWKNPLLWGLYLGFCSIDLGFLFLGLSSLLGIPKFVGIHALAFGGIGLVTMSFMARVSLGHSGGNVRNPSKYLSPALTVLTIGFTARVICPVLFVQHYSTWIVIAQICWILSFAIFTLAHKRFWLGNL